MKNSDYWKQRFEQLESAQNKKGAQAYAEIEALYKEAQKEIEGKIAVWYQRFADNNNISMAEARKWLTGKDLKEFKWDVQEYIKHGEENALNQQWMKELENASAKYHISKLEALKLNTQNSLETLFAKQHGITSKTVKDAYKSDYYHTAYELQKGFGLGWDIAGIDQNQLEKVISKPWAADGYNFSERIWNNKDKLVDTVHKELTQNIMLGADPQKAIDNIAKKMNTSKLNAGRLVMTEEAYFSSAAQKECFDELDVEKYEILATLDSHTSDICRSLDGKVFDMKDFQPGVTAPPFHVYCRSTTVPYFDDDFGVPDERAARDENGEAYYVPDDMKYPEWKKTFVEDGDKSGLDVYEANGTVHYKKHVEPEPEKPKKEYLTKKKLQAKIADADVQLEDLDLQFQNISGLKHDEIVSIYGNIDDMKHFDSPVLSQLKDMEEQIKAIEAQKDQWQAKLDEKLKAEQKKILVKQQLDLEAQKSAIQQQLDDVKIKTYSGMWKDDVTTTDWSKLNIQGKKDYYQHQIAAGNKVQEFQKYLRQLDELDAEGKSYADIQQQLKKIEMEISKVQADLTKLEKSDIIKVADDAFSQERKDAALWFDKAHGGFSAADAYFDPPSKLVHGTASKQEQRGFYTYTSGSGGHNRPLAGFEKPYYESGSGWEAKYYKGAKNVWIDYEGKGDEIRGLTNLIEKSTYDSDVWLQSGQNFATLEGFLEIPYDSLYKMTDLQLQQYVGTKKRFYQFLSTAVNKGGGSSFNYRPMKLNIYAPKGSQMLYTSNVGAFGKDENEMILQRGGTYRITKIYWGKDDTAGGARKLFVDMELHPEEGYDLFQQDPNEWKGLRKTYKDK